MQFSRCTGCAEHPPRAADRASGDRAATLLHGPEAERAAALLAAKYPLLHGRLVPAIHRRKGWTTQHYESTLESH